jgi:hypothetical protein
MSRQSRRAALRAEKRAAQARGGTADPPSIPAQLDDLASQMDYLKLRIGTFVLRAMRADSEPARDRLWGAARQYADAYDRTEEAYNTVGSLIQAIPGAGSIHFQGGQRTEYCKTCVGWHPGAHPHMATCLKCGTLTDEAHVWTEHDDTGSMPVLDPYFAPLFEKGSVRSASPVQDDSEVPPRLDPSEYA